ncbi:MAG: transposase, partial [Deinococcota bacterium]
DGRATAGNTKMPVRKPKSLSTFVAGFKAACTKRINKHRQTPRIPVWQRNYYEHIVRDEDSLNNIRKYIINNPANWQQDEEYEP